MGGIRIRLNQLQLAFADWIARERRRLAVVHGRKQTNGAPTDEATALWRDVLGARCEYAAWLWLKPTEWRYLEDKVNNALWGLSDEL